MESYHVNTKNLSDGLCNLPITPMALMDDADTPVEADEQFNDVERRGCINCPVLKQRLDELETRVELLQNVLVTRQREDDFNNGQMQRLPNATKNTQSRKWVKMRFVCRCLTTVVFFGLLSCMFYCVVYARRFADSGSITNSTTSSHMASCNHSYMEGQPQTTTDSMDSTYPTSATSYRPALGNRMHETGNYG